MKTNLLLTALAVLALTSCEKLSLPTDTTTDQTDTKTRNIQFVMKGLDVNYSTRATLASESITDLYIFEGNTLLKHQVSTDTDFGTPTIALSLGAHDLTFIASKSEGQAWADGKWTCTKVKDTYGTVLSYTVSSSSTSKQVQLTRVNGKVQWTIEDALPSTAKTLQICVEQCYGLDANLNGTSRSTYTTSFDVTSLVGTTGVTASTNVLPSDHTNGSDMEASITIADASNNELADYANTVTITPNVICNIHGTFFSSTPSAEVSILTDWTSITDYDLR